MIRFKGNRDQKKLLKDLKKSPDNPKLLIEAGWMAAEEQQYDEARQYFSRAIELRPDPQSSADAAYGLGLAHIEQKAYEQARDAFRAIIRDYPDYQKRPEVHFSLAEVNETLWRQAAWKNEKERLDAETLRRAIDHYEQAIERRSEQHAAAEFFLAKILCDIGREDEALPHLKHAAQLVPLDQKEAFELHYLLGALAQKQQDLAAAKTAFETALKKGAKPERVADVSHRLGAIAQAQQDDDAAIARYEKALAAYGNAQTEAVFDALANLSALKFRHRWHQDAANYAERALRMPNAPEKRLAPLLKILAESFAALKEYEKAAEYEDRHFDAARDHDEKADSLLRLGAIHEQRQQPKEAVDAYRKGLKFAKRNLLASKLNAAIGQMYLREERLNQAINHLKEAAEFAADDAAHAAFVARLSGECHAKRGETELAIEAYGAILSKYKETAEEPFARQELKNFRKALKKEIQDIEHEQAAKQKDAEHPVKPVSTDEQARLLELIDEMLDEKGFFERLKEGLAKTHLGFIAKIEQLLAARTSVDDELIEHLEEILILSDLGVATTQRIIGSLQDKVAKKELRDTSQVKFYLKREVQAILEGHEKTIDVSRATPYVILVIGVNGTGKTTTIGKLASKFKAQGKDVLLVAGDTFRAAAIEQLEIWGQRAGCDVIKHASGADPSAVLFDAVKAARSRNVDVLIADTAGRLHTKQNLMEELRKMVRVISREMPGAPHEILMVIDATTGQNAIQQAQIFNEGIGITGFVLTKLDGTAKGGIIVGIANDMNIPVTYIGIGEKVEDLREFRAKEFIKALFEE